MDKFTTNLVSKLNESVKRKKVFFKIRYNLLCYNYVLFLFKQGLIHDFKTIKNNIIVFLNLCKLQKSSNNQIFYQSKKFMSKSFRKIFLLSKGSKNLYVSKKKLKLFFYCKKPFEIYVVSTKLGLLTSSDAVKKNLGGKLCLKIIL